MVNAYQPILVPTGPNVEHNFRGNSQIRALFFQKSVQIMAHCIGATSVFASLLSGNLKGKVRNIIVSQVAMNPIISKINYFKKTLPTNKILTAIGIHGVTVETSENAPIYSRILDGLIGMMVNNTLVPSVERCQDPVCHR